MFINWRAEGPEPWEVLGAHEQSQTGLLPADITEPKAVAGECVIEKAHECVTVARAEWSSRLEQWLKQIKSSLR